ncbi:MAG: hypothetical protein E6Q97_36450 [Desulfurellales bacterium]|nr:MAG: hypothetical protein E6Q97_36450 [Desulfurellales bacterium]
MLNVHDQEAVARIANNWRLTPATLASKLSGGTWIPSEWLRYASIRVASGIARGNARIIISAPPRHGKSELVSVYTPVWALENFSDRNIILTGYGAELTELYGRRVRDTIREHKGLLNTQIRDDVSKVSAFQTTTNGYMFSVGLGGAITGRGAHILIIDDYIKEIKEALSPAQREYIWNWFTTTAMTRLEPGASVIIIATRWHSDDLIGRIIKNHTDRWEVINFPAFAGENDLIGRKPGQPLFPERYNTDDLLDKKDLLGSIFFNALYQQTPTDESAAIANKSWINTTSNIPENDYVWARVWDLAASDNAGDWTVGVLIGYSPSTEKIIIANIVRKQISSGKIEETVRNVAELDGQHVKVVIEQEPGSSGKNLVQQYKDRVLKGFVVEAAPTVNAGSKLIRAQPFLAACEAGKVYLLDETVTRDETDIGGWQDHFLKEFESFPGGAHDDQVDAAAAGYNNLTGKRTFSASWGRPKRKDTKPNSQAIRKASLFVATTRRVRGATFGR